MIRHVNIPHEKKYYVFFFSPTEKQVQSHSDSKLHLYVDAFHWGLQAAIEYVYNNVFI